MEPAGFFKDEALAVLKLYQDKIPPLVLGVASFLKWIPQFFLPEYYSEIEGIAEAMGIDYTLGVMVNYIYELQTFCTSTIVKL